MPSPRRLSRERNRRRRSDRWWIKAFNLLGTRWFGAVAWLLAALLCLSMVVMGPAGLFGADLWDVRAEPETARGLALALMVGLCALAAMWWNRIDHNTEPEGVLDKEDIPAASPWWGRSAVIMMVAGATVLAGFWLASHRHLPAGELLLPLGESVETVTVAQGDRDIQVMLPLRMSLVAAEFGPEPAAQVRFFRPRQDDVEPRRFVPGQTLDVEGMRFAFSGFAPGQSRLRATLADEQGRQQVGGAGGAIRFHEDGPIYRIVDMTANHLGVFAPGARASEANVQLLVLARSYPLEVLGPAVKLADERGREFWVYQRDPFAQAQGITLEKVEEIPAAVMTTTEVRPVWPFPLGILLLLIGWGLFLIVPEWTTRRGQGQYQLWSINAAESLGGDDRAHGPLWKKLIAAALVLLGLGGAAISGASPAALIAMAAVIALGAVAFEIRRLSPEVLAAAAIPLGAVLGGFVAFGPGWGGVAVDAQAVLWAAMGGGWLAMAAGLVIAGIRAERGRGAKTGGAVTAGLAVWATLGGAVALLATRGRVVGESFAVPLRTGDRALTWSIPDLIATSELELAAVTPAGTVAFMALAAAMLATLAVAGQVFGSLRTTLFGWGASALASTSALLTLVGVGSATLPMPGTGGYEEAARQWLRVRDLPTWLVDRGGFNDHGPLSLDMAAMAPEVLLLSSAAFLSAAFFAITLVGRRGDSGAAPLSPLAGRDTYLRALTVGVVAWAAGLGLAWVRVGAAGLTTYGEWLGLGAICFALGLLVLGWRRGPSSIEGLAGTFGPALSLAFLIWVGVLLF